MKAVSSTLLLALHRVGSVQLERVGGISKGLIVLNALCKLILVIEMCGGTECALKCTYIQ